MSSYHPAWHPVSLVRRAHDDRMHHRLTARRILVENGLSFVLIGLFLVTLALQLWTGHRTHNQEQWMKGEEGSSFITYLGSGHSLEALAENWESEFLQMAAFVWLTSFLFQKGSPESNDPYAAEDATPVTADSPWPVHRGGMALWLYERSLSLTFLVLFLVSFWLHALGGAWEHSQDLQRVGQPPVTWWQYMGTSRFWFESMQNWQSEFLSLAAMVILSIFLRQKGSAESKPVQAPHSQNE